MAAVGDARKREAERAAGELVADVDTLTGFIAHRYDQHPRMLAEALVAAGFGNVAAARREALLSAADALTWKRPEKSPCAPDFEKCCGREDLCDAMRPSVIVVGPDWLRDRAHRIGAGS